jgi:hypothetical protein
MHAYIHAYIAYIKQITKLAEKLLLNRIRAHALNQAGEAAKKAQVDSQESGKSKFDFSAPDRGTDLVSASV